MIQCPPYTLIPRPYIGLAVAAAQSEGDLSPTCKIAVNESNHRQTDSRRPEVMHELFLLSIPLVEEADVVLQVL